MATTVPRNPTSSAGPEAASDGSARAVAHAGNGRRTTANGANGGSIAGQLPLEREAVMSAVAQGRAMGQAELARYVSEALGVSTSTAVTKIRSLEREGAIVGYRDGRRKAYLLPGTEPTDGGGEAPAEPALEPAPAGPVDTAVQEAPAPEPAADGAPPARPPGYGAPPAPPSPRSTPAVRPPHRGIPPVHQRVHRTPVVHPALRPAPAHPFPHPGARPPAPLRKPRGRLKRAAPIALVVIGTLLLAEGAVTVLWQEPLTALSALRSQDRLDGELEKAEQRERRAAAKLRTQRKLDRYMAARAVATNSRAAPGEALGRLKIDRIGLNVVMVQTTSEASLQKGPAHYSETVLPGSPGIMGIAGHRTTYSAPFRNLDDLKIGNEIVVAMPYGRFVYSVVGTKIVDDEFQGVFTAASFPGRQLTRKPSAGPDGGDGGSSAPVQGVEDVVGGATDDGGVVKGPPSGGQEVMAGDFGGLALTACHPLYSAAQRIVVYARLKSREPVGGAPAAKS